MVGLLFVKLYQLALKCKGISLKNVKLWLFNHVCALLDVATARAATLGATMNSLSKAFTVEFEAFWFTARAFRPHIDDWKLLILFCIFRRTFWIIFYLIVWLIVIQDVLVVIQFFVLQRRYLIGLVNTLSNL